METKKQGFGSKLGFILAAVGSAVGLGNIWRFPYLVGQYGGGAFVIVYLLSVLLLGSVVMIAETYLGKRAQTNIVNSYGKVNKWLKWIGLLGVIIPFVISTYYAVIGGWATGYATNYLIHFKGIEAGGAGAAFGDFVGDPIVSILFFLIFLGVTIFIVCGGVQNGIEKAGKIMMPGLFLLLLIVIICAVTLPAKGGTVEVISSVTHKPMGEFEQSVKGGLTYYLGHADFTALGWEGTVAAMGQSFYSLSLGMGVMVAYGSYTGKNVNLGKSALTICTLDTLVALLAGFAIFPAMFATGNGLAAANSGASLMFIAIPEIFAAIPGGYIVGFLFFTLVIFAALTSLISLVEVVSQYTIDKYQWTRSKATVVFGGAIGLIGLFVVLSQGEYGYNLFGFDLLTYFDEVTNIVLMPILAMAACITVGYILRPKTVFKELEEIGSDFKAKKLWMACCMTITPVLICIVWIMGIIDKFDTFGKADLNYGFVLVGAACLVVGTFIWNALINNKKFQVKMYEKDPKAARVVIGDDEVIAQLEKEFPVQEVAAEETCACATAQEEKEVCACGCQENAEAEEKECDCKKDNE